ncbi:hypothetical protein [Bacillus toyonensis]|uniref:hypothetical protein n=1 Tax=Bacillus toyonensis TaxID=155322 RepID=UPI001C01D232|nr:hypothetical protein [Bacillus toyonensis]QWI08437.1 hypothetical protein EXW54_27680 [Bacillus toyonensis]
MSVMMLGNDVYNFVANGLMKFEPQLRETEIKLLVEDWQYANYISFVDKYKEERDLEELEIAPNEKFDINEFTFYKAISSIQYQIEIVSYLNSPHSLQNLGVIKRKYEDKCKRLMLLNHGVDIQSQWKHTSELKENNNIFLTEKDFIRLYNNLYFFKIYGGIKFIESDWLDRIFKKFYSEVVGKSIEFKTYIKYTELTAYEILPSLELLQQIIKTYHQDLVATEEYEHLSSKIGSLTYYLIETEPTYVQAEWATPTYQ